DLFLPPADKPTFIYQINRINYYWPTGPVPGSTEKLDRLAVYMRPDDTEWRIIPNGLTMPDDFVRRWLEESQLCRQPISLTPPRQRRPSAAHHPAPVQPDDSISSSSSFPPGNQELYIQQQKAKKAKKAQGGGSVYVDVPPAKYIGKGKGRAKTPPSESSEDELGEDSESELDSDSKDPTYDPYEGRRREGKEFAVEDDDEELDDGQQPYEERPDEGVEGEPEAEEHGGSIQAYDDGPEPPNAPDNSMEVDEEVIAPAAASAAAAAAAAAVAAAAVATAADDANPAAGQPRLIPAKPGRPSNDVREACRKGAEEFFKLVEYIANTYGYSESQIFDMMQIGPRPKEVRASDDHSWNAWVSYFYLMHPLEKGGNAAEHRQEMRDLYVALTTGMSDEEKKQFAKELKAVVVGMQPGGEGHPSITRKTIPGRLKHAEEQIMK
ncbi:hypothetical protein CVT26_007223, partial [Gymnopilus dilepis]